MVRVTSRKALLRGSALAGSLFWVMAAGSALAQQQTYNFDIQSEPLGAALRDFAHASNQQIIFSDTMVAGKTAPALHGDMTSDDALGRLLAGTDLSTQRSSTGGIVLHSKNVQAASNEGAAKELPVETVVVIGIPELLQKNSINADIQRSRDDAQPYVTYDSKAIQNSQAVNLDDFFKTKLPMNTTTGGTAQSSGNGIAGVSTINLRGLGTSQTLILVDGRRLPTVQFQGGVQQSDIDSIPLTSIERIEILPSTASGIYGGGATGGVVNVITKKDKVGEDLSVTYGNSTRGDAENYRLDASAGFNIDSDTHVLIGGSYSTFAPLAAGSRDFLSRARALELANNPSAFYNAASPPLGYLTNIRNQNGTNLVLKSGAALNSPITFVPLGYSGPSSDGGAALLANAGQYNLALPNTLLGAQQDILAGNTTSSLTSDIRHRFNSIFQAFVDVSWSQNRAKSVSTTVDSTTTLSAAASNNPFTTPVVASFPATGLYYPAHAEQNEFRAVTGLIFDLPWSWSGEADYSWSNTRLSSLKTQPITGDPDGSGPGISDTAALSSGTLNVIQDLNRFPLNWSPYLLQPSNSRVGPSSDTLNDATLHLAGPIFSVPGGQVIASGLVEWRREDYAGSYLDLDSAANVGSSIFFPPAKQKVLSFYGEVVAPVVSPQNDIPFVRALTLQGSVRRDEYDTDAASISSVTLASRTSTKPSFTFGSNSVGATKFTIAGRYSPVDDFVIRGSFGTGFLAPSITQIVAPSPNPGLTFTIADPLRGNVPATAGPLNLIAGGNPGLKPEESESWSLGGILTPSFVPDLRISLDFTHIAKKNEINVLSFQDVVSGYPSLVTRAPLTPADIAAGYTGGAITAIQDVQMNFAHTQLATYDLQADYTLNTDNLGAFHFLAIGTWEPEFKRQVSLTSGFVNQAGYSDGPLKVRINGGVDWSSGPLQISWNAQYYSSYLVYTSSAAPATIASVVLGQGSTRVSSQLYNDVFVSYRLADVGLFDGARVSFGVRNIFDSEPSTIATTGATGGYSTYGDPRLRRFTLTLSQSW